MQAAGELACRPGSVHPLARAGGHPSRTAVADSLVRSTREHRAGRPQSLAQEHAVAGVLPLDLAPGGVYQAAQVTLSAGGLLHHRFTLTPGRVRRRSVFCGTIPRVTPGRRYRPPCPAEPGPSSACQARPDATRPPGQLARRCAQDTGSQRRRAAPARCQRRPPASCELRTTLLSESGCPAGCRTRRCSATAPERTASARTPAASRSQAGRLAGRLARPARRRTRLRRGRPWP